MDPNTNIAEQRKLAERIIALIDEGEAHIDRGAVVDAAGRLAELVQALDEWRRMGGFDPYAPDTISRESIVEALRDAERHDSAADAVEYVSDLIGWEASRDEVLQAERAPEEAAKEAATCSECLARTYRGEECVCEDGGDAVDYDEALEAEAVKGRAHALVELLHDGVPPHEAVTRVGLSEGDYSTEDPGLTIGDPDNDLIDLLWHGDQWIGVRRTNDVWAVEITTREENDRGA